MAVNTTPNVAALAVLACPRDADSLEAAVRAAGRVSEYRPFDRLHEAVRRTPGFFERVLPFVWRHALDTARLLPPVALLDGVGRATLTQRQCLCILAHGFFCTYAGRPSTGTRGGSNMPSINFDQLFGGDGWGSVEIAKLQMFFHYFDELRRRDAAGDPLDRPIHFLRRAAENSSAADWRACPIPLAPIVMHGLKESIDDAKQMFRVDFANRRVGGSALATGCVQEEIMFCICPELTAARLFCPTMRDDEAVVFLGVEQFSTPKGYAGSFEFGGPYVDPTPRRPADGALASSITAIDAYDYRDGGQE
ncbi:MAG: hypothetical protein ACRDD1_19655, partial [Planctomycetia bacterium]